MRNKTRKFHGGNHQLSPAPFSAQAGGSLPLNPAPFSKKQSGGQNATNSWLWGVSKVSTIPAPVPDKGTTHSQKGAGKKYKKGGLSSQLVPLGLTAAVLASRSKKKYHRHYPHKGMPSRTRKGRLDFITHKGDKFYNRDGHRQSRNRSKTRRNPFK